MSKDIESGKLLVKEVFDLWFTIPAYQRPYVWEKDQITELLDDVIRAAKNSKEAQYFLGSMVLRKHLGALGNSTFVEYELLDGQQRLTTLFLITAVIRDLTPLGNDPRLQTCRTAIYRMANPDDNVPERLRITFDIRNEVRDFVDEFVKTEKGTSRSEDLKLRTTIDNDVSVRNMANAITIIREYFSDPVDIESFFPYLRSKVLMIYVAAAELEDAFQLFTVMNSRGIKLRNSDILKARNLGAVTDKARMNEWAKKWEEMESQFGEDLDAFLGYIRTIIVKQKASVSLLKEFEDNIYNPKEFDRTTKKYNPLPPRLRLGEDTFKFVDRYRNHYTQLFSDDIDTALCIDFELYNLLHLMRKGFEADFWIAPVLRFYDRFKTSELVEFVRSLDNKFGSDWLTGLTPTSRIDNVNRILDEIDGAASAQAVLLSGALAPNPADLRNVLEGNLYGKRAARYVLLKLDLLYHGHTTQLKFPDTITIEHILPQNPYPTSRWAVEFSADQQEQWVDRIGNLVLISRSKNSSQGNRDYHEKKERYFNGNVELFSNSIRIYQKYPTWTPIDLEKNQADVIAKLVDGFGI